jgi:hypothetical protein
MRGTYLLYITKVFFLCYEIDLSPTRLAVVALVAFSNGSKCIHKYRRRLTLFLASTTMYFVPLHNLLDGLITSYSSYDSGSPIIIPGDGTIDHPDVLVALVSWGVLCADPDYPGVNARVSEVSDWIDAMVCDLSDNPPVDFFCGGSLAPSESPSGNPTATTAPTVSPSDQSSGSVMDVLATKWSSSSRTMVILILLLVAAVLIVCLVTCRRFLMSDQDKHKSNKSIVTTSSSSLGAEEERLRPDINYEKEDSSYDSIVGVEVSDM